MHVECDSRQMKKGEWHQTEHSQPATAANVIERDRFNYWLESRRMVFRDHTNVFNAFISDYNFIASPSFPFNVNGAQIKFDLINSFRMEWQIQLILIRCWWSSLWKAPAARIRPRTLATNRKRKKKEQLPNKLLSIYPHVCVNLP